MSILVLGSINTDLVVASSHLPRPGETVIGGSFDQFHGGKGANQAVAAARLARCPVTFVGCIGDDSFGRDSLAHLREENLDCRFIKTVAGVPSGVALILVDADAENAISVASGANFALTPSDIDLIPGEVFDQADVMLASLEIPIETVARSLERAKDHDVTTIVNPAPANVDLLERCMDKIDILTPNEGELHKLSGQPVDDGSAMIAAARQLLKQGCRKLIVTIGSRGAIVVDAEDALHIPANRVQAVDTTAAGDAFNGALAVQLVESVTLSEAVRWANQVAAISVTRAGAQSSLPTRDEVEQAVSQ